MNRPSLRFLAPIALAGIALAACGSSSKSSSGSGTTLPAPTTTVAPTTTTVPGAGGETVALATVTSAKVPSTDKVLVDGKGMTLYVWDNDKTAGQSDCKGGCAQAWPPLDVTGTPTYGAGLQAAMFSEVTGPNGEKQLAVNGKPLYYFTSDKKPGGATGQGVGGFYVVTADGKKVDND